MNLSRTDGTASGTQVVAPLPAGVSPTGGAAVTADRVFFAASSQTGYALWMTTTTTGIMRRVAAFPQALPSSRPHAFAAFGDRLLFTAQRTGSPQPQLWSSGGTAHTTTALTALVPVSSFPTGPEDPIVAGDQAFFRVDPFSSYQARPLWRTDGTAAGTFPLLPEQRIADHPALLDGELYYVLDNEPNATVVWKSDGTVAGTKPAFDLPPGVRGPRYLTTVGDELYFIALSIDGSEVWKSDGTTAGVRRVTAFVSDGAAVGDPDFVVVHGGVLFFARNVFNDAELWITGGTPESTRRIASGFELYEPRAVATAGGYFYFFAFGAGARGLWRTDGTEAFPVLLRPLTEFRTSLAIEAVQLGGQLFFPADDGIHGAELWTTDGTAAGTRLVADVAPGVASSSPRALAAGGGAVFFAAHDGVHGFELWKSDGSAAGTRLVHDIAPGAASSYPTQLMVAGPRLYFAADDRVAGEELWALDLGAAPGPCVPSATALCLGGHFRVEATWVVGSQMGAGSAVPLTNDTGGFWFFGPENVEVVLKVLDGRGVNGHQWVFYGALSDVQYHLTVTDTESGLTRRYANPAGELASVADTTGFGPAGAYSTLRRSRARATPPRASTQRVDAAGAPCEPSPTRLCLRGGRFAVEATWKDFAGHTGVGTAVALTSDTGWFWFFGPTNVEVILKVLDGTPVNGKHWVFYGALSSVEYTLRVSDTQTGAVRTYTNPSGNLASVADTSAF
ncbi:MAG TPA: ELWxxDGT repeat protein [Thermoanaerobaculia bacterium]|nr:ELWxxDGT repeat protein [Thermoanaerobaculia bacterium]